MWQTIRFLVGLLAVVVRFDGSFRLPARDGTARMATAAATISLSPIKEDILLLGGSHLDTADFKTSGEVEFAGLLLGLEGILQNRDLLATYLDNDSIILVQGDCKTAIQQMTGRSVSRRLRPLYKKAEATTSQIPWKVHFEHIPRHNNLICDRLCRHLMTYRQYAVKREFCEAFLDALSSDHFGKQSSLQDLARAYFAPGKTAFSGIERLHLYGICAEAANLTKDYEFLKESGERMAELADILAPASSGCAKGDSSDTMSLQVEGVMYQIHALRCIGQERHAMKLEQRRKTIMKRQGDSTSRKRVGDSSATSLNQVKNDLLTWMTHNSVSEYFDRSDTLLQLDATTIAENGDTLGAATTQMLVASVEASRRGRDESHWVAVRR